MKSFKEWLKMKESRASERARKNWTNFADPEKDGYFGSLHGGSTAPKSTVDKYNKIKKKKKKKVS